MKELNFDWLLNGSCLLSDVAMAYFTTCVYPRSAGKRMRDEIERYPNLYAELLEAGYKRPNTLLTPRQICIVIRHWGMPDTVYKWLREHPADRVQKLFADRKFDGYILYIFCLLFIYVQVCMLAASNFARTES